MKGRNIDLPDNILRLVPLTPAVFFCLFALADGAKHGYAMMQATSVLSGGKFRMGPGTLYSTIQRLLELDLVEEVSGESGDDERRRYYKLTPTGTGLLQYEIKRMSDVLQLASERALCRP